MGIAGRLSGGDPRSLGEAEQVVADTLADPTQLGEVFGCLFDDDPVVRMRAGDAVEKVARQQPQLLAPYVDRLLTDVAPIEQASVQWHLAQILAEVPLTPAQQDRAIAILEHNVTHATDWIVLNLTMESLTHFAQDDPDLRRRLIPTLHHHTTDHRKAVAKRASRLLHQLQA